MLLISTKILFSCSYSDYDLEAHVYVHVYGFNPAFPHVFFYCLREDEPSNNWVGIYISVHGLWKIYYLTRKRKNDDIKGILQKTKQRL